jgi:hypothetical protein
MSNSVIIALVGAAVGSLVTYTGSGLLVHAAVNQNRTFAASTLDEGNPITPSEISWINNQLQKGLDKLLAKDGVTLTTGDICTKYKAITLRMTKDCVDGVGKNNWEAVVQNIKGTWVLGSP